MPSGTKREFRRILLPSNRLARIDSFYLEFCEIFADDLRRFGAHDIVCYALIVHQNLKKKSGHPS